ncbi:MAG: rhomboid family intramembrane serine protease [Acidobacteriota bacterium]
MFPLRDTIPSRHLPLATWSLIVANLVIFTQELLLPPRQIQALFTFYGVVPARYMHPGALADPGWAGSGWLPFFTSMFLHAGWLHVLSNMWVLWIFGDNVEDRMGPMRFSLFYVCSGLIAGLVHMVTNAGSAVPTVGASGAIAGVMGAYLLLFPSARVIALIPFFFWPLFLEVPAVVFMLVWFAMQFSSGLLALGQAAGGVAWWAHVGGFLGGMIFCPLFLRPRRP